jgi:hypothetical protein
MTTAFYSPSLIDTVPAYNSVLDQWSIPWNWNPQNISENAVAVTSRPLYTISGMWMERFLSNTDQLWCTNFNIPDVGQIIVGIEVELSTQRAGRIQDLVVQLIKNGQLIGNNYASTINPVESDTYTGDTTIPIPVGNYNIYGSSTDMWGTTLTSAQITDSTFGVAISFKSNQIYPHSDLAQVSQVGIRITYA